MTTPTPKRPVPGSGDGPISLGERVQVDQAWLATHTPELYTAWQQAQTPEKQAQLATQIEQAAASQRRFDAEGQSEGDDPSREFVNVRIQWAETTRYEADFYLDPYSTDDQLWSEIAMVSEAERRTLDVDGVDNTILSVVDLDGDGIPSVLERATATATAAVSPGSEPAADPTQVREHDPMRWVELADSIDRDLARGSDWPRLAAALDRAAASGYDVAAKLPGLAAADELPDRHPARELHYRLLSDCDGALPANAPRRPVPVDSNPSPQPTQAPAPGPARGPAGPGR